MKRMCSLLLLMALFFSGCVESPQVDQQTISKKAGLGDTIEAIEKVWYKGHKKEVTQSDGSKNVVIGLEENYGLAYCSTRCIENFGTPERAGRLEGSAKLLIFSTKSNPTREEFFESIKDIMPRDFVLKDSYIGDPPNKELFVFTSKNLFQLPGIEKAVAYRQDGLKEPAGSFSLIVNYDIDNPERVYNFTLFLGAGTYDTRTMKKINNNPFNK